MLRQDTGPIGPRPLAAVLALCLGCALSIGAFFTVQGLYRAEAQKSFEGSAVQLTEAVSQSLGRYLEVVNAVGAFFAASKNVDRWEFFEFARDTLPRFPGVTALTWVPWVPAGEREAFEGRARDDGLFGFRFKDAGAGGELLPAAPRQAHFPVFYVEPFEGNVDQLGIDLAGRPEDLEILLGARDSGQCRDLPAGCRVRPQRPRHRRGVLPVYRSGDVPQSLDERQRDLLGFARASIALPDLIASAMPGPAAAAGLDVYIYDDKAETRHATAGLPSGLRPQRGRVAARRGGGPGWALCGHAPRDRGPGLVHRRQARRQHLAGQPAGGGLGRAWPSGFWSPSGWRSI